MRKKVKSSRKALTEYEKLVAIPQLQMIEDMLTTMVIDGLRGKLKLRDADQIQRIVTRIQFCRYRIESYPAGDKP